MKKKLIVTLLVLVLLLGGAATLAVAGSTQDPFVSLDYLNKTVQPSLDAQIATKAAAVYEEGYQTAITQLSEALAPTRAQNSAGDLAKGDSNADIDRFAPQSYGFGDTIKLQTGSNFLLLEGSVQAQLQNGELIDVTRGMASNRMDVQPGSRYLVGEGADLTLTVHSEAALLALVGSTETKSGQSALPFTDISRDSWYFSAILFVRENKLFNGVNERHFAPEASVTRGMLATVLYRLAQEPALPAADTRFDDVAAGAWYAPGVQFSASASIVKGMGDGTFAPDETVTREQLATMLHRYATEHAKLATEKTGDLTRFTDRTALSSWAEEAMAWAVGAGILNGDTNAALKPDASASRAETATMIQRFETLLAS